MLLNGIASRMARYLIRWNPSLMLQASLEAKWSLCIEEAGVIDRLCEIPSETTLAERCLLYKFFSTIWNGCGAVVEVGPFMGGTTRAIALGMRNNIHYADNVLLTYDKFTGYYDGERLVDYLMPLFESGVLNAEVKKGILDSINFLTAFNLIHQGQDYFEMIRAYDKPVPATRDAEESTTFKLPPTCECSAFFVDGCKSWYSTKAFMKEAIDCAEPGSYFIFQDFGWFTCFWIPMFLLHFKKHFKLVCFVDCTYVFQLRGGITSEVIESDFPDDPTGWDAAYYIALFDEYISGSMERDDVHGVVFATMQKAAALAYIGKKEEAKQVLLNLRDTSWARSFQECINRALHSPTYYPDGSRVTLN